MQRVFFFLRHLSAGLQEIEVDHALGSNGSVLDFPPRRASYSCIQMNGKEVFRFAVRCVPQSIESALEKAGLNGSTIDWLLLHQVWDIHTTYTRVKFKFQFKI